MNPDARTGPEGPAGGDDDEAVEAIRAWIVERLYSSDPPELSAVEPIPLFDVGQVDDALRLGDER
jgi:hypothetical protein